MLSTEKIIEIADQHSTPLYILDKEALENRINEIKDILGEGVTLCYAMKANPFLVRGIDFTLIITSGIINLGSLDKR